MGWRVIRAPIAMAFVCELRLGRKKQERTKQRRDAAKGAALLFVAIHGGGSQHGPRSRRRPGTPAIRQKSRR